MSWKKIGLIWNPKKDQWWNKKYGQLPVPLYLKEQNKIRIFFGSADENTFCRINFIDVCADNPVNILNENPEPVLDIGELGTFDDSGVVPSSLIIKDDILYLYTVGYQRSGRVPYMLFAGLIESKDFGVNFIRTSKAPILPRNNFRPTSQGAPCVLFHEGVYKMWHWFSTKWINVDGKLFLDYKIGYAESDDAVNWVMQDLSCIEANELEGEFAVARPWVVFESGIFKMWYSIRHVKKMYRIGYAESNDGINWKRLDHLAGIEVSDNGWDSEMICYPALINVENRKYMFYNGNDNGATGFGVAVWEND
ncbi:MAG: hypothetical protein RL059_45 [Bacteroidota bacterium]|jgi:predicted GH43/DUF377 family glycosyl hydrolase